MTRQILRAVLGAAGTLASVAAGMVALTGTALAVTPCWGGGCGCVDSPESATAILGGIGLVAAVTPWARARIRHRKLKRD